MSTYGNISKRRSLKNWLMKGAERLIENVLLCSSEYSATCLIASGQTVKKKPFFQEKSWKFESKGRVDLVELTEM